MEDINNLRDFELINKLLTTCKSSKYLNCDFELNTNKENLSFQIFNTRYNFEFRFSINENHKTYQLELDMLDKIKNSNRIKTYPIAEYKKKSNNRILNYYLNTLNKL